MATKRVLFICVYNSARSQINESLCIGCAKCVELCPKKILFIDRTSEKCKVSDETKCDKLRGTERPNSRQSPYFKRYYEV